MNRPHQPIKNTPTLKKGLAQMMKGGVIMDVVTPDQAKIAEAAGAVAVMALERVPSDIRKDGGVARMSDPKMIKGIKAAVSIPVMAKVRIGHFVEAQILEALGVDYIDESEVLTPADEEHHIDKAQFKIPFVCGARNLGEALRRIQEGAAMIRTKGEAGTGNVVEAVRHMRAIQRELAQLCSADKKGRAELTKEMRVTEELVEKIIKINADILSDNALQDNSYSGNKSLGFVSAKPYRLCVVNFAAGGIATPADAALMMQLGSEGVFVGSGIFKSSNPEKRARAIVEATLHYDNPDILARVSENLGEAMESCEIQKLEAKYAERGV